MRRILNVPIVISAVIAIVLGCSEKPPQSDIGTEGKPLAVVNGISITEEDVDLRLQSAHGSASRREAGRQKALEDIIQEELLYQEGLRLGLDQEPIYRKKIARLERQLANIRRAEMARRVYNTEIASRVNVTHEDARDYYDAHAGEISKELHLGVITFNNRVDAERALKEIRGGTPFKEVASRLMGREPVEGREPWDLGFVPWERIPFDFTDSIYRLNPGEVSEVLSSPRTGFQLFTLLGARENPAADYPSVSGMILNRLLDQKIREAYEQYVARLRREGTVVVAEGGGATR